jgi:uncharacterized protein YjbI with pentapeptide repeats
MANDQHVAVLKKGVDAWNAWRGENPDIHPDLGGANLIGADLFKANLSGANLFRAYLGEANLIGANLFKADVSGANLIGANLSKANLSGANFIWANLIWANLSGANLSGANLAGATIVETDLTGADLSGCCVHGVSAWGLKLEGAKQQNLIITNPGENEPVITVDNIEVAQFIYLLLHNQKVRDVIDTITSKVVLILGRFTEERKAVLDALQHPARA